MLPKRSLNPMPEPGSAKDRFWRFVTKIVMVPFAALWIGVLGYAAVDAARKQDVCALLGMLGVGAWFGFVTWSALAYAFTGYYPRAFVRLWNAMWSWLVGPMPLPPQRRRKS